MEPFLQRLANALLQQHQHELDQVAVVLPGRRAGLHLRRYLSQSAGRTIWSPEMLNMGAFMERFTGLRQGGSMEMLFLLYEAHRSVQGANADPLPEFLQWAPVTLRDMSEVDAHLLHLGDLYRDLGSYHEIDEWSFRLEELSKGQQRLSQQWRSTGAMHVRLHELMQERATGTSGWISRHAAETAPDAIVKMPWRAVWFAGLNALDPATTIVISALIENGKAVVAWDADRYYLEDADQEAGAFLRRSMKALGTGILPPLNEIRERERNIHSVAVPNAVAQVRHAAQSLAGLKNDEIENTVVVLADEHLLMPLLEGLPPSIGAINVTMGMPLRSLPVHGLIESLIDLHNGHVENAGFHHSAIEKLFLHPFLYKSSHTPAVIRALRKSQRPRMSAETICELAREAGMNVSPEFERALDPIKGSVSSLRSRILDLLSYAKNSVKGDAFAFEQLFRMARLQHRLDEGLEQAGAEVTDIRSYNTLRSSMLREENIGFFGEPLSGVQIMGLLETRALDHERVIVLGANDGVLPPSGQTQSWIPFEIRRAYQLPLRSDTEAIAAYHFERLLQLANEVHLVHDSGGKNGNAGPTRYLEQWRHELIGDSRTSLHNVTVGPPFPVRHAPVISVRKDPLVLERVAAIGAKGISPSALATWLTCPLDFYFKYVLRISPPEEVDEKLGSDVLGEAVHHVMERIFTPFIGRVIEPCALLQKSDEIKPLLLAKLSERSSLETLEIGHFRLKIEMASSALRSHIKAEAARNEKHRTIPLLIEKEVMAILPNGMIIRGRCDRIDERDGIIHILDVKTGGVRPEQVCFKALSRDQIKPEKRYGLQLLMYAWAYMMYEPGVDRVRAGIIPLQKISQAEGILLNIGDDKDITRGMLPAITALLMELIDELMDPTMEFTHVADSLYCACCVGTK